MIKVIIKYRNYPSIIAIKKGVLIRNSLSRSLKKNDILKEIKNLQVNKATQDPDIPNTLLKNNSDLFVDFSFINLNDSTVQSKFLYQNWQI